MCVFIQRDPNRRVRTPSSYLLYAATRRKQIILDNPELTFGDVSKYVGQEVSKMKAAVDDRCGKPVTSL